MATEMLEDRARLSLDVDLSSRPDYEVTLVKAGDALNGWRFPAPVLRAAMGMFEGASSFVDHVGFLQWSASVRNLVGVVSDVEWDADVGDRGAIKGRLRFNTTPAADWLEVLIDQIVEDRANGLAVPNVGLSADLFSGYVLEGRTRVATEIRSVYSVDIVFYPAAGGSFDRVLNSVKGGHETMKEDKEKKEKGARVVESVPDEVLTVEGTEAAETASAVEAAAAADAAAKQAEGLLRSQCATVLEGALTWCELPQPMKDAIRTQFSGRVFAPETLESEIERYRTMLAGMLEDGVVKGAGDALDGPQVSGMLSSLDRVELAFQRLMGVQLADEHSDIARLSGIREMYLMMTGDHDFYGKFYPERVRLSNVTTASMTSVVKNVLNKILLQAYNVRPRWWKPIAYEEDFGTLNQITWMKTGGIGALPTVAEGAAYTELDWSDAEETADFLKKGGYIGITLEMMDRDDVGAVKRIPREIGNAA